MPDNLGFFYNSAFVQKKISENVRQWKKKAGFGSATRFEAGLWNEYVSETLQLTVAYFFWMMVDNLNFLPGCVHLQEVHCPEAAPYPSLQCLQQMHPKNGPSLSLVSKSNNFRVYSTDMYNCTLRVPNRRRRKNKLLSLSWKFVWLNNIF